MAGVSSKKPKATYGRRHRAAQSRASLATASSTSLQPPASISPSTIDTSEAESSNVDLGIVSGTKQAVEQASPENKKQQLPVELAVRPGDLPQQESPPAKRPKMVQRMGSRTSASPSSPKKGTIATSPRPLAKAASWSDLLPSPFSSPSPCKASVSNAADIRLRSVSPSPPRINVVSRSPSPVKSNIFQQTLGASPTVASSSSASTSLKRTYGSRTSGNSNPQSDASNTSTPRTIRVDRSDELILQKLPSPPPSLSSSTKGQPGHPHLKSMLRTRDSYRDLRAKLGVDSSSDEDLSDKSVRNTHLKRKRSNDFSTSASNADGQLGLQGITVLRTQGKKKQVEDELFYLLEGLTADEATSLALRRSTALDLGRRILIQENTDFSKSIRNLSLLPKVVFALLEASPQDGDLVIDVVLACLLSTSLQDRRTAESLFNAATAAERPLLNQLVSLLGRPHSHCSIYESCPGMKTKREKSDLARLQNLVSEDAKVWSKELIKPGKDQITLQRITLVALEMLCEHALWGAHERTAVALFQAGVAQYLESMARHQLSELAVQFIELKDGKTQIVSSKNISLQLSNLSATLRVLEATTPALDEVYLTTPTDIETLPLRFSASLGMAHVSSIPSTSMEALSVATDCSILILKVLINLTNASRDWSLALLSCKHVVPILIRLCQASQEAPSQPEALNKKRQEVLAQLKNDTLSLSLALLTNLLEAEPVQSKTAIRETSFSHGCGSALQCTPECTCSESTSALSGLTAIFEHHCQASASVDAEFVRNYSSILLGLLMLDCPENEAIVTARLRSAPQALAALKSALQEYAGLQRTFAGSDATSAPGKTAASIEVMLAGWADLAEA